MSYNANITTFISRVATVLEGSRTWKEMLLVMVLRDIQEIIPGQLEFDNVADLGPWL